ncbi:hypothetical protein [Streptomyces sp. NPDC058398]|uniref:hypothetical protein n=1 Tax=Streptomyces sp. NPDC058398 TaxID=3346479 RepID=UPI00365554BE
MRELGRACSAVQASVGRSSPDEAYLDADEWGSVIAIAARLAQVMVTNDLQAAALVQNSVSTPERESCRRALMAG